MAEDRTNAERQKRHRDKRRDEEREAICDQLDGSPDHIVAVATNEWDEGYEARCLVRTDEYAKQMLYVPQNGMHIVDDDGFYNRLDSREGRRALALLMDEQRQSFQEYLRESLTDEQWGSSRFDAARRKLRYPSHRAILEICKTLESVNAVKGSRIEQSESYDMNRQRLLLLDNGVIDIGMEPIRILTVDEVRERKAIRPEQRGRAEFKRDAHIQNNPAVDKLAELVHTHARPLRYLWHLMVTGGDKQAGYLEAIESNAGKSTMLAVLQEATGQLGIADRKIMIGGSRFNHLEAMMTKFLLVAIDEADKAEQISPHFINSAINAGRVHIEEKYASPVVATRRANLVMVAGGAIPLDWQAQGISPDQDRQGGRFRSMVTLEGKMDIELGLFLNSSLYAEERQGMLTALLAYLTDPTCQWNDKDKEEALDELMAMTGSTYADWQVALLEEYTQSTEEQWVASKDIKKIIDDAGGKAPSDKTITQFIKTKFNARKERLTRSEGRGMAWRGMAMRQHHQTEIPFDGEEEY